MPMPAAPLIAALEQIGPHDHLCSIYETQEEQFAFAIPFIRTGLDRGEKCIYIADESRHGVVRATMHAEGIDVERALASKALVLTAKEQSYLKQGVFNTEWMSIFWKKATELAMTEGFSALRATGEADWILRDGTGLDHWWEYESKLTDMLCENNCFVLCQYNRRCFPPRFILDVIRTHPVVVYRGAVCRNFYHVPPDEFRGDNESEREVKALLTRMGERERVESELSDQQGELLLARSRLSDQQGELLLVRSTLSDQREKLKQALSIIEGRQDALGQAQTMLVEDIIQRKRAEALLFAEKHTLEMIARGAPLSDVLNDICSAIDEQSTGAVSTVLLMDPDGQHLRPVAGPRLPGGWRQAMTPVEIGPKVASCGAAAFRKEPVVVSDIASDPLWTDFRDAARRYGLEACWSSPLLSTCGNVLGTFDMYNLEPRSPEERDLTLIERATHLAQIAIERERAQKALRESEQRSRLMVEGVKDYAIFMLDTEGRVATWNAGAERIKGYREEEILGKNFSLFYPPEEIAQGKPKEALAMAAATDGTKRQGWRLRKDGTRFWADVILTTIRDEAGTHIGFSKVTRDLTERKQAEEELRKAHEKVEMILNSITDRFFAFDNEWRFTYFNKHAEEQLKALGKDPVSLIGKVTWDEFQADPAVEEAFRRAMREGAAITHEHYYPPLGEWVENRIYPSPDGGVAVFQGYVTERKRAEEELRRSEAFLAEGQRISHTGSWSVQFPREDVFWSQEMYRIYGLDPATTKLSQPMAFQLIHSEDRPSVHEAFERALREKSDYDIEHRAVLADGSIKHLHALGHPMLNESGDVIEYVGTVVDTTEQHETRAALEKAFEEINILKDRLYHENLALREEIDRASMFEEIVGSSPALKSVLSRVARVAPMDSTVLITGETGTGKELIARAIHKRSRRADRAFVAFSCAGVPSSLIAAELFGHEKGAFTGAQQRRLGRFELAEGGTIFLDEVGELTAETQIALLRVIQEKEFERVGSSQLISTDVRIIAASNRNLEEAVVAGAFRLDLFYRLNVFPIEVPPLRERKQDIPMLLEYFIKRHASKTGKRIGSIDKKTVELFKSYSWPGNVRELQSVIERSVILCESEIFSVDENWLSKAPVQSPGRLSTLAESLLEQEKKIIEAALAESKGRIAGRFGAAAKLGIPSSTLESKIIMPKIKKNRFKSE